MKDYVPEGRLTGLQGRQYHLLLLLDIPGLGGGIIRSDCYTNQR